MFLGRNDSGIAIFGDAAFAQSDYDDLARAGANYVQVSVAGLYSEKPPYALDPAAQLSLDQAIERVTKAGMFAVIAVRTGPGRNEDAITGRDKPTLYEPLWTDAAAQAAWVDMVRYMAQRYGSSSTVVGISPMVEPNDAGRGSHSNQTPKDFYAQIGGTLEDVNVLFAKATVAIRTVDSTLPILLEPEYWGGPEGLPYLKVTGDTATIYTLHDYEPFEYTHRLKAGSYPGTFNLDGQTQQVDKAALDRHLQVLRDFAITHKVPIAITEFGVQRPAGNAAAYLADRIALQSALCSWAAWTWQPAGFDDPFNMHDPGPVHDVLVSGWKGNCRPSL